MGKKIFELKKNISIEQSEKYYEHFLEKQITELLFFYGMQILKNKPLNNYEIYENVFRGAIELNLEEWIYFIFNKINNFKINKSKRLSLLKGALFEYEKKNEKAFDIYKELLTAYPCDIAVRSKIINLKKILEKDVNKIISILNEHLKEFPLHIESWHELGEIYIKHCLYSYSLYCFEEILLHKPNNLYFILTCAELHYTINQLELSSKYFCLAIQLQPNNIRALWGIVLVNINRYYNKKIKNYNDNVDIMLTIKCIKRLYNLYEKTNDKFLFKESILQYLKDLENNFN